MLVTVTLNPALDVSGTVDRLVPDEKSYVRDEIHTPGGNGINAAIIAHRLGANVLATGLIGGSTGEEIKDLLDIIKVRHGFVPIRGKTRMNLTVNNCDNHKQTRLSFPGPKVRPPEREALKQFLAKVSGEDIVAFGGSLPPGVNPAFVTGIVKELKRRKVPCLVDMPGKVLREVIQASPFFIKPNLLEFQELTGKNVASIKEVIAVARELCHLVPLVCVSSVQGGAVLVTREQAFFGRIPEVTIRSTVGAGDSMVGAISAQLIKNPETDLGELLRWGLAASCATLTERGMALGSRKSIMSYRPQIYIQEIK